MLTKEQSEVESTADVQQPSTTGNIDRTAEETDRNVLDKPQPDDHMVIELQSLELDAKTTKDKELELLLNFENQFRLELTANDETLSGQFDAEAKQCEEDKLPNVSATTQQSTADSYANDLSLKSVTGVEMLNKNVGAAMESEKNEGKDFQRSVEIQYLCSKSNGEVEPNVDTEEGHLKETCVDLSFERGFNAESDNKVNAICESSAEQKDINSVGNNLFSDSSNSDEIKNQIQAEDHFEPKSEYISNATDDVVITKCLHDDVIHGNQMKNGKIGSVSIDDECIRINHHNNHDKKDDHDVNDEENQSVEKPKVFDEDRSETEHTFVIPGQSRRTEGETEVCEFRDVVECSEAGHDESKCESEDPASLIFNSSAVQNCIFFENQDVEAINNTFNQSVNNVLEQSDPIHLEICSSEDKNISLSVVSDNCLNDTKADISTDNADTAKDPGNSGAMTKFKQNRTKMKADQVDNSTATEISSDPLSVLGTKVNSEDDEKTMTPEVFMKFEIFFLQNFLYMFTNKLG